MRSRSLVSRITVLMVALLLPLSALAGDEVGKMRGNSSAIEWDLTRSGHDSIILYVKAPDGTRYEKTFRGNATPTFRSSDTKGCPPDGVYKFELRVQPLISGAVKAALAAARASGDDARAAEIMKANGLTTQVVQSGAFGAANCAFLDPSAVEPDANDSQAAGTSSRGSVSASAARPGNVATDDQVIPDDLIVQGSACVGLDCVNNENFGFDTIRLKENNLRIHYDDTSTSAGFPANDWRLVGNDSASGGQNKFSIEDSTNARNPFTVEAAAPANSLYVDSTGNIGFQQSAPALDLHLTTTDTPALRLEQSSAGGFTAQTWDIGANEANFFVRDVTGGSRLSFRIRPGAPTSSLDISADGDIGINTGSPNANTRMDVFDSTQIKARVAFTGQEFFQAGNSSADGLALLLGVNRSANRQLWIADTALLTQNSTNKAVRIHPNNGAVDAITTDGNPTNLVLNQGGGNIGIGVANPTFQIHHSSGARLEGGNWTNASSRFLKQNITQLSTEAAMAALRKLEPVTYQYKNYPTDTQVGFVAEDVPELVATPDHKALSAMDVVAVLTKVVKEQQQTIDELKQRLEKIENQ